MAQTLVNVRMDEEVKREIIGGFVSFNNSKITDLKMLNKIGGLIFCGDKDDLKRQWEVIQKRVKREKTGREIEMTEFESSDTDSVDYIVSYNETIREGEKI